MTDRSAEFIAIADEASKLAACEGELDEEPLRALEDAAEKVGRSWSGSSLGYQANVYYKGFQVPPAGARFSREWGFEGMFQGTTGEWEPHRSAEVVAHIETLAGNPDLSGPRSTADKVREPIEALIHRARSVSAKIPPPHDDYLKANLEELQHVALLSLDTLAGAQMRTTSGQFVVRDMQAAEGGWQPAGHQIALANAMHIRSPYKEGYSQLIA